jgi:hypothetical protein
MSMRCWSGGPDAAWTGLRAETLSQIPAIIARLTGATA